MAKTKRNILWEMATLFLFFILVGAVSVGGSPTDNEINVITDKGIQSHENLGVALVPNISDIQNDKGVLLKRFKGPKYVNITKDEIEELANFVVTYTDTYGKLPRVCVNKWHGYSIAQCYMIFNRGLSSKSESVIFDLAYFENIKGPRESIPCGLSYTDKVSIDSSDILNTVQYVSSEISKDDTHVPIISKEIHVERSFKKVSNDIKDEVPPKFKREKKNGEYLPKTKIKLCPSEQLYAMAKLIQKGAMRGKNIEKVDIKGFDTESTTWVMDPDYAGDPIYTVFTINNEKDRELPSDPDTSQPISDPYNGVPETVSGQDRWFPARFIEDKIYSHYTFIYSHYTFIKYPVYVPPESKKIYIKLDWDTSDDIDLHIWDPSDRHVGWNNETGQIDYEIPNCEYSGYWTNPEWIECTNPAGGWWEIGVAPYWVSGEFVEYSVNATLLLPGSSNPSDYPYHGVRNGLPSILTVADNYEMPLTLFTTARAADKISDYGLTNTVKNFENGIVIGSHTRNHAWLPQVYHKCKWSWCCQYSWCQENDYDALKNELSNSRQEIQSALNTQYVVSVFRAPYVRNPDGTWSGTDADASLTSQAWRDAIPSSVPNSYIFDSSENYPSAHNKYLHYHSGIGEIPVLHFLSTGNEPEYNSNYNTYDHIDEQFSKMYSHRTSDPDGKEFVAVDIHPWQVVYDVVCEDDVLECSNEKAIIPVDNVPLLDAQVLALKEINSFYNAIPSVIPGGNVAQLTVDVGNVQQGYCNYFGLNIPSGMRAMDVVSVWYTSPGTDDLDLYVKDPQGRWNYWGATQIPDSEYSGDARQPEWDRFWNGVDSGTWYVYVCGYNVSSGSVPAKVFINIIATP